jgi:hypothetical protein
MPGRYIENPPAGLAPILIVFAQPAANLPRLDANQGVCTGVEIRTLAECPGGNGVFVDFREPTLKIVLADQFDESLQLRRPPELRRMENSNDLVPLSLKRHPNLLPE